MALVALLATALLTPDVFAQDVQGDYTIWTSVVFTRTGERTPEVLGFIPTQLTSVGANQAHDAGAYFRQRYINSAFDGTGNESSGRGDQGAPIYGLAADIYSSMQTYAITLDQEWNVATAQAFMQGLYPPFTLGNTSTSSLLDPTSLLANGTYIDSPLGGYQYPYIHVAGGTDPNFIYLSGHLDCPSFANAAYEYTQTPQFSLTQDEFDGLYDAIGPAVLLPVLSPGAWDYWNAYAIYDYLQYQYAHNETVAAALDRYYFPETNTTYLSILEALASEQQYAQLGNLSALNNQTGKTTLPTGALGSISTIAGNMFAAKVLGQIQDAINYYEQGYFKLNLLFADYAPLLSFFALVGLPDLDENFYGMPNFGSSAVFEVFSYTNATDKDFPGVDDLWVRFLFRNGTDDGDEFRSYPLFNRGPDATDMTFSDFSYSMQNILMSGVGDWCTQCGATNLFCTAFNESAASAAGKDWLDGNGVSTSNRMNPVVAGVIGAIVALVVASLLFGLLMLVGGVRFHRNQSRRKSDLGGFKGGQKMASDQDLTIPKGGAIVGASVVPSPTSPTGGHERVGSWELKQAEPGKDVGDVESIRGPSMEEQRGPDPFQDPVRPVQPHERV